MNAIEFFLWLNGYLEALESEGVEKCNIKNIRNKMEEVKTRSQERVVFGPNITPQGYAQQKQQNPVTGQKLS